MIARLRLAWKAFRGTTNQRIAAEAILAGQGVIYRVRFDEDRTYRALRISAGEDGPKLINCHFERLDIVWRACEFVLAPYGMAREKRG